MTNHGCHETENIDMDITDANGRGFMDILLSRMKGLEWLILQLDPTFRYTMKYLAREWCKFAKNASAEVYDNTVMGLFAEYGAYDLMK